MSNSEEPVVDAAATTPKQSPPAAEVPHTDPVTAGVRPSSPELQGSPSADLPTGGAETMVGSPKEDVRAAEPTSDTSLPAEPTSAAASPSPDTAAQKRPAPPAAAALDTFKRPLAAAPKRKRFRKTVLDEDNFIRELEGIVERDFFPDMRRLRAQNDYLSAAQSGDTVRLHELRQRYGSEVPRRPDTAASWSTDPVGTPSHFDTPRPGDTPGSSAASEAGLEDDPAKPLSLNQYLATHTSEDDESFSDMMSEARRRHRVRHPWFYEAEAAHNDRQEKLLELELPSVEEQAGGGQRPGQVATWKYTSENDLMYVPRGLALTAAEKIERAKHGQEIRTENTRFQVTPFNEGQQREVLNRVAQTQSRRKGGKIDVDGREHVEPTRRGLVRTPSPAPGVDQSPLMTWGQIDGTPFRLDGGDTPAAASAPATPSFRILEASKREKLAHELAERASSRHRDKKARALETARRQAQAVSPALSDRLAGMSPAARRLAKVGRTTDKALRASYTPSPARRAARSTPATPTPAGVRLTPASTPTGLSGKASITDDLLQLPTRPRAADFFTS
ncbi:Splicing factor ESS-2 [Amphibalanus amphitrite]|uniref:Splicing factor ESS-2 n=1 Tax=Amphibalanus amphitrite TaxID=1232801 RepID=A0A6A4VT08_AMPAM|nr:Splicing factor ESS-2 [Amphibalanus amphitrite]